MYKCTVPFCDTRLTSGFAYLSKSDLAERQRWIEILNLDPKIKSHRICANHFEKSDFGDGRTNKVLKKGKKPSKNIPVRQFLSFASIKETCSSRSRLG